MISFNKKHFPKSKFILAVSGGTDSVAVAHLLKRKKFDFIAVHVNNKFIEQDDEIASNVKHFFEEEAISYEMLTSKEKFHKGSKEDFCRKIRYKALCDFALKSNCKYICTAHHLNDCVESYFLNFLKGQPEYVPIAFQCKYQNATIFRPFLLNKKIDFVQYLSDCSLTNYVTEDELNSDISLMRNWTRREVLPTIEKKYKGLYKVVFKKMKQHLDNYVKNI